MRFGSDAAGYPTNGGLGRRDGLFADALNAMDKNKAFSNSATHDNTGYLFNKALTRTVR